VAVPGSKPVPAVWRPLVSGLRVVNAGTIEVPLDGSAQVRIETPPVKPASLRFELAAAPRGVSLAGSSFGPAGINISLKADLNIAREGSSGNAIIGVFAPAQGGGTAYAPMVSLGVLPAIPLRIVQ